MNELERVAKIYASKREEMAKLGNSRAASFYERALASVTLLLISGNTTAVVTDGI